MMSFAFLYYMYLDNSKNSYQQKVENGAPVRTRAREHIICISLVRNIFPRLLPLDLL